MLPNKTNKFLMSSVIAFFVFLHVFLININSAEWGDSYRILRASEILRNEKTYPADEKRPPLYSVILAARPSNIDPIISGKIWMFIISIASFTVFISLVNMIFKDFASRSLAYMLFALNPVFLYWSIRLYADVFFALLVLIAFTYIYKIKMKEQEYSVFSLVLLAFIGVLGVLTRFEGYILIASIGIGLLFSKKRFKNALVFGISVLILLLPYYYFRNPFSSTYFEEPGRRVYDLNMIWTYFASLLFVAGFTSAFGMLLKGKNEIYTFLKQNLGITAFVGIELLLAFVWPAAIPRLFVPAIPFLIIFVVFGIKKHFTSEFKNKNEMLRNVLLFILLLMFYGISQYFLKLQFLVLYKPIFLIIILLQVANFIAFVSRNYPAFFTSLFLSLTIWSIATIWLHKDIYISVKNASEFAAKNLCGTIAYNDVSSVTDWYLNYAPKSECIKGVKLDLTDKKNRDLLVLENKGIDYALVTNEHNTDTTFDISKYSYLSEIKDFSYDINGKEFFTKIIKVEKKGIIN